MSQLKVNLEGKVALVSGANRGIGKSIVEELLNNGVCKIYAGARNLDSLKDLQKKYAAKIIPLQLDVTDINSIKNAAEKIEDLDILVNNAGVFSIGKIFSEQANMSLQENLDVNVWGLMNLSNAVIKHLRKSTPTAIVNISSLAGIGNMPMCATYSISKAAVHSMTQGMRAELIETNNLVMGVYPGPIDTEMAADLEMDKDSPVIVAKAIVNGLLEGTEDIYPDQLAVQFGAMYATSPKGVEQQFAQFA